MVSGALAYNDPQTGELILSVVDQAVYLPSMECNLLCPMQVHLNDVAVDEVPKFLAMQLTE